MRYLDFLESLPSQYLYVIAEVGLNHEGDVDLAKRLIEDAHFAGADAVKFQSYKAAQLVCEYSDPQKQTRSAQFDFLKRYDGFWKNEYELLKRSCEDAGVEFMSTAFDDAAAVFLNDLQDVFKIASGDITHKPLIERIASFGKPMILSTGAAEISEIDEALSWIPQKPQSVALLHCILNYPTKKQDANLGMLTDLQAHYPEHILGYSDHVIAEDMSICEAAYFLGARILEKHFTHNKSLPHGDHPHSMDKQDLQRMRKRLQDCAIILGSGEKKILPQEREIRTDARRSIISARDIHKGEILSAQDLTYKRPATGISPKYFSEILGKRLLRDIKKDTCLFWGDIEQ